MAAQEKFRGEGGRKLKCVCALPFTDNVRPPSQGLPKISPIGVTYNLRSLLLGAVASLL